MDDLRARIAEALRETAYSCDGSDCGQTEQECEDRHPVRRPEPWRFRVRIEGSPEGLADAVMAVVRDELDRLTVERNQAGVKAQRLHSTLLHFAAEAHRRKWRYDLGEDPHGNQIKSPAFDALHWLGNDLLAALNRTRAQETAEPCCDVPSAASCEQDDCPGTRTTATKE